MVLRSLGALLPRLLTSVVIGLVVGEALTRIFGIVDIVNKTDRNLYETTEIDNLPYRLRPNVDVVQGRVRVGVNAHGLRGPALRNKGARDASRILVLGDSVVFGTPVENDQTFPARLEHFLAQKHGWAGQVLNAGVPGYNTATESAYLKEFGDDLSPDQILLGVCFNDFRDAPRLNSFGVMTQRADPPGWLEDHSEFFLLLKWGWKYARGEHLFQRKRPAGERWRRGFEALAPMVKRDQRAFYANPKGKEDWMRVRRALVELRSWAEKKEIPFTVVLFPQRFEFDSPPFRLPAIAWRRLCESLGIEVIDLWPVFQRGIRRGRSDLFVDAQHPTAAGLNLAASFVADQLSRELVDE